ncbi:MAPEG family protein [Sinimarinibacterium sp. CAU 1509]|uniref:MAPEG family protein n=1 Tax=Sinimarinibacterium sp. CAU 1509 TaxID=2562283 RepID=UPI0010AB8FF9|nr:MAPEG family protein [Sinimarinibacterium sp. CAU 1509]TJY62034.1 MAPEG family protein [Sinimarinibacterium sp. CAU 1509]
MSVPVWSVFGFALWTLLLLLLTVGVYRWSHILSGRIAIRHFRADRIEGADWYRRAMRAHANCVENLPVFGAIVFALNQSGLHGHVLDIAAVAILPARITQSLIHVVLPETNFSTSLRFSFFLLQIIAFFVLAAPLIQLFLAGA